MNRASYLLINIVASHTCTANKKSTEKAAKNIQTGNIFKQSTVSTNFLINLHKNPIL